MSGAEFITLQKLYSLRDRIVSMEKNFKGVRLNAWIEDAKALADHENAIAYSFDSDNGVLKVLIMDVENASN